MAAGAYLLQRTIDHFPAGTVHLAVVDPGVGSDRRALAIEVPAGWLVGPDNGLFALALRRLTNRHADELALSSECRAISLTNPAYWRSTVSSTFHGRDIFAPIAARLAGGEDIAKLGDPIRSVRGLPASSFVLDERTIQTRAIWIDHFGNVILAVHRREVSGWKACAAVVGAREVPGPVGNYEKALEPRLLFGSSGLLEIAAYRRSAAEDLDLKRGDEVTVRRLD